MGDLLKFVKFQCKFASDELPGDKAIEIINQCRTRLHDMRLIGVNEKGEGFGNISIRHNGNEFIVTASQTGQFRILEQRQFVFVKECMFETNEVIASGMCMPSSESLSHGAVYKSSQEIDAVIHIHYLPLWTHLMGDKYIFTPRSAREGTIELAQSIFSLFQNTQVFQQKIFALGGHESGIIAFGSDIVNAENVLLDSLQLVL